MCVHGPNVLAVMNWHLIWEEFTQLMRNVPRMVSRSKILSVFCGRDCIVQEASLTNAGVKTVSLPKDFLQQSISSVA